MSQGAEEAAGEVCYDCSELQADLPAESLLRQDGGGCGDNARRFAAAQNDWNQEGARWSPRGKPAAASTGGACFLIDLSDSVVSESLHYRSRENASWTGS